MFFPFHDDNPTSQTPVVTIGLVAINVVAFLWASQLSAPEQQTLVLTRGFIPARIAQLSNQQPLAINEQVLLQHPFFGQVPLQRQVAQLPPDRSQILLSLVTCLFLHAGWAHLIGNMWFLWLFGGNVEDRLGRVVYSLFYLGGGLLATACHWAIDPSSTTPIIGASGAVAAVLGAYAITWPWARVHTLIFLVVFITVIDVPALLVLGVWFLGQVLEAREQLRLGIHGGVALWAHIGGFLAGLAMMPLLGLVLGLKPPERPEPPAPQTPEEDEDYW